MSDRRKVYTLAAFNIEIGAHVADVEWERIAPGVGWVVISRGFNAAPADGYDGPSRGMWLLLEARP